MNLYLFTGLGIVICSMSKRSKKVFILFTTLAIAIAVISTSVTFAWYTLFPLWNNIVLKTGDESGNTYVIYHNFLKTYDPNSTQSDSTSNKENNFITNVNSDTEKPSVGTSNVTILNTLNYFLFGDDKFLDEDFGYVIKTNECWFGFSEINIKQAKRDMYLHADIEAYLDIASLPEGIKIEDYVDLIKITYDIDENNYIDGKPLDRSKASNYFESIKNPTTNTLTNMKTMQNQILTSSSSVSVDKLKPTKIQIQVNGSPDILMKPNRYVNDLSSSKNIYERMSFSFAFGVGIYVDPSILAKLVKLNKVGLDIKLSVYMLVSLLVSNKPFVPSEVK